MSNEIVSFQVIGRLKWPEDAAAISMLDLIEKQVWYSSQDPRAMIYLGNNPQFKRWWKLHYMFPLKLKRLFYKLKSFVWSPY